MGRAEPPIRLETGRQGRHAPVLPRPDHQKLQSAVDHQGIDKPLAGGRIRQPALRRRRNERSADALRIHVLDSRNAVKQKAMEQPVTVELFRLLHEGVRLVVLRLERRCSRKAMIQLHGRLVVGPFGSLRGNHLHAHRLRLVRTPSVPLHHQIEGLRTILQDHSLQDLQISDRAHLEVRETLRHGLGHELHGHGHGKHRSGIDPVVVEIEVASRIQCDAQLLGTRDRGPVEARPADERQSDPRACRRFGLGSLPPGATDGRL